MTNLSLIVAMDENRLIGSENGLPWHLPADLAYFKRTTMGKPIIMGRKTFDSIGRALPGRRNIVITRDPQFDAPDCEIAGGVDEALALCAQADEIMLIGGASLYQQTLPLATCLYVTLIHHGFGGDTWFPEFDENEWRLESRTDFEPDCRNVYAYSFIKFVREI
jgi:dihydrofolate reductase